MFKNAHANIAQYIDKNPGMSDSTRQALAKRVVANGSLVTAIIEKFPDIAKESIISDSMIQPLIWFGAMSILQAFTTTKQIYEKSALSCAGVCLLVAKGVILSEFALAVTKEEYQASSFQNKIFSDFVVEEKLPDIVALCITIKEANDLLLRIQQLNNELNKFGTEETIEKILAERITASASILPRFYVLVNTGVMSARIALCFKPEEEKIIFERISGILARIPELPPVGNEETFDFDEPTTTSAASSTPTAKTPPIPTERELTISILSKIRTKFNPIKRTAQNEMADEGNRELESINASPVIPTQQTMWAKKSEQKAPVKNSESFCGMKKGFLK